jgi:putative DNA primase/helicase
MIVPTNERTHNKAIQELSSYPQWVAWESRGKRKVPIHPDTGRAVSAHDPEAWMTYPDALNVKSCAGIGFALTVRDPFGCIDLDNCRNPHTGEVAEWAMEIVEAYGSYVEVSPSGTGLHIWIRCEPFENLPKTNGIEAYYSKRYMTYTGNALPGFDVPIREVGVRASRMVCTAMDARLRVYHSKSTGEPYRAVQRPYRANQRDDHDIIELCRKSYGNEFEALYDRGERGEDASVADYRLFRKLAWASGCDPDTMIRIFASSALATHDPTRGEPDKHRRADYLRRTAAAAIRKTPHPYDPDRFKRELSTRQRIAATYHHAIHRHDWRGNAGRASSAGTDFAVYMRLLEIADEANSTAIGASERQLTIEAGIGSRETVRNSIRRLETNHRLLRRVDVGKIEIYPMVDHSLISSYGTNNCAYNESGTGLGKLFRHATPDMPEFDRHGRRIPQDKAHSVRSVGKVAAWILALIEAGYSDLDILETRTGIRRDHIKYRELAKLLDAGLIEATPDGGYAIPGNLESRMLHELHHSGCIERMERQERKTASERKVYRIQRAAHKGWEPEGIASHYGYTVEDVIHVLTPPEHAPTDEEMEERRTIRNADGTFSELARGDETFPDTYNYPDEQEPTLGAKEMVA